MYLDDAFRASWLGDKEHLFVLCPSPVIALGDAPVHAGGVNVRGGDEQHLTKYTKIAYKGGMSVIKSNMAAIAI